MQSNPIKIALAGAILVLGALACNYPGSSAPTPFVFPTPNLTPTGHINPNPGAQATRTQAVPGTPNPTPLPQQNPSQTPAPSFPTATSLPPATRTPLPTVSYEGPEKRDGVSIVARYLDPRPVIDGTFGDWDLEKYSVDRVVAGAANWTGDSDLSAKVMFGWDEDNLYLAARVKDDRYVQGASGEELFKGDSLEILLDTDVPGDFYLDALDGDDYQLGISPGSPDPGQDMEAYLWFPRSQSGSRSKVKIDAVPVDDGYRVEVAIPWSTFDLTPDSGQHFGFAFSVSDNDQAGRNLQQSMASTVATRLLTDPTTWGDLVLSGSRPQSRSGAEIEANFVDSPPELDGKLGDWELTYYPVSHVVYGEGNWANSEDLSGNLLVTWDQDNLYLGAQVFDTRYVQNATGKNLFLGDSLEILFDRDLAGDFNQDSLSNDDYQLGVSPGSPDPGDHPQAYLWFPQSEAGSAGQVEIGARVTSDGYILEAAIPWEVFGVTPAADRTYGFAFSISDNDNPDQNLQQSMVSTISSRVLTGPTTWGTLKLLKP